MTSQLTENEIDTIAGILSHKSNMAKHMAELANLEETGQITNHGAKLIAAEMVKQWDRNSMILGDILKRIKERNHESSTYN